MKKGVFMNENLLIILLLIALIVILGKSLSGLFMKEAICPNCGFKGKPKIKTKGSIFIEIILWCCFIVPGLIYSIWRITSRQKVCRSCEYSNPVPLDSPKGRELLKKYG